MDEDDNVSAEISRLRAIGAWMREVGATELDLGDVRIKLSPKPPAAPGRVQSADPDIQAAETDAERLERAIRDEEAEHREYWRRVTRSSGAPIPPFKPERRVPQ